MKYFVSAFSSDQLAGGCIVKVSLAQILIELAPVVKMGCAGPGFPRTSANLRIPFEQLEFGPNGNRA